MTWPDVTFAGCSWRAALAWGGLVSGSAVPMSAFTCGVVVELDRVRIPVTSIAPGPRHPAAFCQRTARALLAGGMMAWKRSLVTVVAVLARIPPGAAACGRSAESGGTAPPGSGLVTSPRRERVRSGW